MKNKAKNEGFFPNFDMPEDTPRQKMDSLPPCHKCGLFQTCDSPKMEASREGGKGILIIGSDPSLTADGEGIQLVDRAGQFLQKKLAELGIDMDKDCRVINAVSCYTRKSEPPTSKQINYCKPKVWNEIDAFKPKLILLLGDVAVESFLSHRWRKNLGTIAKWRGWTIPDQDVKAWVCPIYDPRSVLKDGTGVWEVILEQDLKRALAKLDEPVPDYSDDKDRIKILTDPDDIIKYLENVPSDVTFDYETTGLKPHRKGHRIVCCSISDGNESVAFPVLPEIIPALKKFLSDPDILKSAANIKFEGAWSRFILDTKVEGWSFDTMLAGHVLDNRRGICGLKFQTYVRFGVVDYDSHIKPYLEGVDEKDANSFNRIDEIDQEELLIYNAYDSLYESRLGEIQIKELADQNLNDAYDLLHEGTLAMADAEANGIIIDTAYCNDRKEYLTKKIKKIRERLMSSKEIKIWKDIYGKDFNFNSNPQLAKVLFQHMGYTSTKKTKTGNPSVDEEALEALDIPMVKNLVRLRKLMKLKNTYMEGFIRQTVDGILRPFYNLQSVVTYRSSSSDPNFQNLPKHDEDANKLVRTALTPRLGNRLMEADYKGIEVRIATCYHKDPVMLKYINDKTKDMHRDMAMECFDIAYEDMVGNPFDSEEKIRYCGKNMFVFRQFYGGGAAACARDLWIASKTLKLADGSSMRKHLKSKGWTDYYKFASHIEKIEDDFWNRRFSIYNQWKDDFYAEYLKKGYFTTLTGFQCKGVMNKKEVTNYPPQGTAFQCLLWSFIQINKYIKRKRLKSLLVGQIHDSIIIDAVPEERDELLKVLKDIMCNQIREQWSWIITPLDIEIEETEIDGNWYDKTKIKG